jgi:hypothetical protein
MIGGNWDYNATTDEYICKGCGWVMVGPLFRGAGGGHPCTPAQAAPPPTAAPIPQWAANATKANHPASHVMTRATNSIGGHYWLYDPSAGPPTSMASIAVAGGAVCADCGVYAADRDARDATGACPGPTPPQGMFTGGIVAGNTVAPPTPHNPFYVPSPPVGQTFTAPIQLTKPNYSFQITGIDYGEATKHLDPSPAAKPGKAKCPDCTRELSAYLDAYHGKDAYLAKRCVDCRAKEQAKVDRMVKKYRYVVYQ